MSVEAETGVAGPVRTRLNPHLDDWVKTGQLGNASAACSLMMLADEIDRLRGEMKNHAPLSSVMGWSSIIRHLNKRVTALEAPKSAPTAAGEPRTASTTTPTCGSGESDRNEFFYFSTPRHAGKTWLREQWEAARAADDRISRLAEVAARTASYEIDHDPTFDGCVTNWPEIVRAILEADDTPRPQTPAPPGSTSDEPTPEMIEAGLRAWEAEDDFVADLKSDHLQTVVKQIHRAMNAGK